MNALAGFLRPEGYRRPALVALLREASVVPETGRYLARSKADHRARRHQALGVDAAGRGADPVVLVPGFMAGDGSLAMLSRSLRAEGFRTYRSAIRANVACTLEASDDLERRVEHVAERRESRVQIVGHSLGGMLARGLAARRPDLISSVVTLGSPVLAPGAHHLSLTATVQMLVGLSRLGIPGLMARDCVGGDCARESFGLARTSVADAVRLTAIYSRRDGVVDWRACLDPQAEAVEVTASHVGMALDPRVRDRVASALRAPRAGSVLEVDRGVGA